jgi:hypothetical protein
VASNEYRFLTRWSIRATPDEIIEILGDAVGLSPLVAVVAPHLS